MRNVDLSKYNQLEQVSQHDLNMLEQAIVDVCFKEHTIENIFVVGSFVFGLRKVNDIDIVVCIKEHVSQEDMGKANIALYRKFEIKYSKKLTKKLNKEINLIPYNIIDFMTNEAKKVNPPMFDLTNRIWINKSPGDIFPYHLATLENGQVVLVNREDESCGEETCTCD